MQAVASSVEHRQTLRARRQRPLGFARTTLRCLLSLSLWHAPVPWLHAHDLQGPVVEHVEPLHRHVDAFHASEIAAGQAHLELHAHLVLPWERDTDTGAPQGPHRPGADDLDDVLPSGSTGATSVLKTIGRSAGALSPALFPIVDDSLRPMWGGAPLVARSHGKHFFETFGSSVSIGDLVGVRLC